MSATDHSKLKKCILDLFNDIESSCPLEGKLRKQFYACKSFIQSYRDERIYAITETIFLSMKKEIQKRETIVFTKKYYIPIIKSHNFPIMKFEAGKLLMKTLSGIYRAASDDNKDIIWQHIEVIMEILFKRE